MKRIVSVAGHRLGRKLGGYGKEVLAALQRVALRGLEQLQPDEVITGMALGWDQAVALACIELGIPFIAAVPCDGQERLWPAASQELYKSILERAAKVVVVSPGEYAPWKMYKRNEWMVDNSDQVLALWDGSPDGGTAACVRYAQSKGKGVLNVWSLWLDERRL